VTLADRYLPSYDARIRHARNVAASAPAVWLALHRADLGDSALIRALLTIRGLRSPRSRRRLTLASLARAGFTPLAECPGRALALGLVGKFWTPSGSRLAVASDAFRDFARPGYAKAVWTFALEELGPDVTRIVTETRVACVDAGSRRRFRLYWLVVRPFSGMLRGAMLRAVAREATRSQV